MQKRLVEAGNYFEVNIQLQPVPASVIWEAPLGHVAPLKKGQQYTDTPDPASHRSQPIRRL
jgi:hypothetical protein